MLFIFMYEKKILHSLNLYFKSKLGNILGILKGIENNITNIGVSTTLLKNKTSQMLCVSFPVYPYPISTKGCNSLNWCFSFAHI